MKKDLIKNLDKIALATDRLLQIQEDWVEEIKGKNYFNFDVHYNIFKNPTRKELKTEVAPEARGFLTPSGDLYVEGHPLDSEKRIIHMDLVNSLAKKKLIKLPPIKDGLDVTQLGAHTKYKTLKWGVSVQLGSIHENEDTRVYLGESNASGEYPQSVLEILNLYAQRAKEKNRYLDFRPIAIAQRV